MTLNSTLDSRYYTDPAIYANERERIFRPNWWLLGPSCLVERPGQYFSDSICGWSVFVIREKSGKLNGFHNICRHRGARLLEQGSGQCNIIKCPYHAWGYNSSGELVATPGFGAETELDKSAHSLYPLRVYEWRGMVFVNLDSDAPEFMQWIGSLDQLMEDFPGSEQMSYHGSFSVSGKANWKTYCDNTVEGYHLHAVHPRLAEAVAAGSVEIKPYDDGRLVVFDVDYGGQGSVLRGNRGLWAYKYPGFQIAISGNAFKIERVEATSIDSLLSTNWGWYTNLGQQEICDSFAWSETVVREDIGICETVMQNLRSGVYLNGPLSPVQENCVALFQQLIKQTVG